MAKAFPLYNSSNLSKRTAKTSTDSNSVVCVGETIAVGSGDTTLNKLLGAGVNIPKNAQIVGFVLDSDQLDSNGTPLVSLSIGDAGSDARIMASSTVARAGGVNVTPAKGAIGYTYTAETLVQVKVKAASATAAAGNLSYGILYVSN